MRRWIPFLALSILLLGCERPEPVTESPEPAEAPAAGTDTTAGAAIATAEVRDPTSRSLGTIALRETDGGVVLSGSLSGLPPGEYGFHIHEAGRCEPPAFSSAGGHFAPAGNPHGFEAPGGPHAGDLWNLVVTPDSTGVVDQSNDRVTLREREAALLDADGSTLVIHARPDDYVTQPSGDSGDRMACGVIEG